MDYKKAIMTVVNRRKSRLDDANILYLDLLRSDVELYETEKELRRLKMERVHGNSIPQSQIDALKAKRDKILESKGVTREMLNPPYFCNKCKDTGLVDGKPCSCVIAMCAHDNTIAPYTFEKSDLNVFPTAERERISSVYTTVKTFCDKFPSTKKLNLLLMGRCGSGKSYLASCIANEISAKGYSVIMLSAFAFNNRMLKYHTTFDSDKMSFLEPLLDCDLLIIDDLGTETMLKNITVEYLFHVINERMSANKHTVFTTNLDDRMICSRYGERTYSRLFGSRLSMGFALSDADLRNRK